MKMLLILPLLMIGLIVYEHDNSGGSHQSYFRNAWVEQRGEHENDLLRWEYIHTYQHQLTLTIRFTNSQFQQALLYTQVFETSQNLSRVVTLPHFVSRQGMTTLHFFSSGTHGDRQWNLSIRPMQYYVHFPHLTSPRPQAQTMEVINSIGNVENLAELIHYEGFHQHLLQPVHGMMNLDHLKVEIRFLHVLQRLSTQAYLLVPDVAIFEGFQKVDQYRFIPLSIKTFTPYITFQFAPLYVHPISLLSTDLPLSEYVPIQNLVFPLASFATSPTIPVRLIATFSHLHTYTVDYQFLYVGVQPSLGTCGVAMSCVGVYHA